MGKHSDHKKMHLQMFPGDVSRRTKIAMLEGDIVHLKRDYAHLSSIGVNVDQRERARSYKRRFAKVANRKQRYKKIEEE